MQKFKKILMRSEAIFLAAALVVGFSTPLKLFADPGANNVYIEEGSSLGQNDPETNDGTTDETNDFINDSNNETETNEQETPGTNESEIPDMEPPDGDVDDQKDPDAETNEAEISNSVAIDSENTYAGEADGIESIYDPQPQSLEDVQAIIDAYEADYQAALADSGFEAALTVKKPHWLYMVEPELMPADYRCELVDYDEEFGADYYTFFMEAVTTYSMDSATVGDENELIDAISNAQDWYQTNMITPYVIKITSNIQLTEALILTGGVNIEFTSDGKTVTAAENNRHIKAGDAYSLAGNVTLSFVNIVLDGGHVDDNATVSRGGIEARFEYGNNYSLELDGAVIQNCYVYSQDSDAEGGGVYVYDGGLTLNNCEISNNAVHADGFASGGGIYACGSELTLNNCEISNNTVHADFTAFGGGIYACGSELTLNGCTISGNTISSAEDSARLKGGGVYTEVYDNGLTLSGCTISENTIYASGDSAYAQGGGVCTDNTSGIIINENTRINDNTINCTGDTSGGGIHASCQSFKMEDSECIGNTAAGAYEVLGGGMYLCIYYSDDAVINTIKNSEISENKASGADKVIYAAATKGGGIYSCAANLTLDNCTVNNNTAEILFTGGSDSEPDYGFFYDVSVRGGGIYSMGRLSLKAGEFNNNQAVAKAGYAYGGGVYVYNEGVSTLDETSIKNNTAESESFSAYGGGICILTDEYTLVPAARFSSGASDEDTKFIIKSGNISENTARSGSGAGASAQACGGGIYLSKTTLEIDNGSIINNTAESQTDSSYGGGIYGYRCIKYTHEDSYGNYNYEYIITINGGDITSNYASYGGGVYLNQAYFSMSGGEITNNTAYYDGGGIYGKECLVYPEDYDYEDYFDYSCDDHSINISGGKIIDNSADNDGGGIYVTEDSILNITDDNAGVKITGNKAAGDGGGIYTEDISRYQNITTAGSTVFTGNSAANAYAPPENAASTYDNIGFTSTSTSNHPLNNYDINYLGETPLNTSYTVTYDPNDGVGTAYPVLVSVGTPHTVLHNSNENLRFTRTGYDFEGWNENPKAAAVQYTGDGSESVNGDTTLYALWKPQTYTVIYTPNGGKGAVCSVTENRGTAHTVLSNSSGKLGFTRDGYTFLGWNEDSSADAPKYTGTGSEIVGNNADADGTIILYAVWIKEEVPAPLTYIVEYNSNGGDSNLVYSINLDAGETHTVLANSDANLGFTRTGHELTGWSVSSSATEPQYTGTGTETIGQYAHPGQTITLYAVWKELPKYSATYIANGGSGQYIDSGIMMGASYKVLKLSATGISRSGYTFTGWFDNTGGSGTNYNGKTIIINENITLYAGWSSGGGGGGGGSDPDPTPDPTEPPEPEESEKPVESENPSTEEPEESEPPAETELPTEMPTPTPTPDGESDDDIDSGGDFDMGEVIPVGESNPNNAGLTVIRSTMSPNVYLVRDKYGTPLGILILPEGVEPDDVNILEKLIPTSYKDNPKTGMELAAKSLLMLLVPLMLVIVWVKKRKSA